MEERDGPKDRDADRHRLGSTNGVMERNADRQSQEKQGGGKEKAGREQCGRGREEGRDRCPWGAGAVGRERDNTDAEGKGVRTEERDVQKQKQKWVWLLPWWVLLAWPGPGAP